MSEMDIASRAIAKLEKQRDDAIARANEADDELREVTNDLERCGNGAFRVCEALGVVWDETTSFPEIALGAITNLQAELAIVRQTMRDCADCNERLRGALTVASDPLTVAASYADDPNCPIGLKIHAEHCEEALTVVRAALRATAPGGESDKGDKSDV